MQAAGAWEARGWQEARVAGSGVRDDFTPRVDEDGEGEERLLEGEAGQRKVLDRFFFFFFLMGKTTVRLMGRTGS